MAEFKISKQAVLKLEGGHVNHPSDRGAETYKGITRRWYANWPGWKIIDLHKNRPKFPSNLEKDDALQALVDSFYEAEFWNSLNLSLVNDQEVATEVFDIAINNGKDFAGRALQRTVNCMNKNQKLWKNIAVDGKIGPATISIVNQIKDQKLIRKVLNLYQAWRFINLCEQDETQEDFFSGWIQQRVQLQLI